MTKLNNITLETIPSRFRTREATPQPNSEQLKQTVLALSDRVTRLLPIEQFEKEKLLQQLQPLRLELADATADRIDLGFLKAQRRQDNFLRIGRGVYSKPYGCLVPKFALFTLDSPLCTFNVEIKFESTFEFIPKRYFNITAKGTLPHLFGLWDTMPEPHLGYDHSEINSGNELWQQVDKRSSHQWRYDYALISGYSKIEDSAAHCLFLMLHYSEYFAIGQVGSFGFTVSNAFTGGLPDDIRQQIPVWQQLYDEVLICREAADWTVNVKAIQQPIIVNRDPLVIGRIDDDYWLLAKFDTTVAEEWVSSEWSLRRR